MGSGFELRMRDLLPRMSQCEIAIAVVVVVADVVVAVAVAAAAAFAVDDNFKFIDRGFLMHSCILISNQL